MKSKGTNDFLGHAKPRACRWLKTRRNKKVNSAISQRLLEKEQAVLFLVRESENYSSEGRHEKRTHGVSRYLVEVVEVTGRSRGQICHCSSKTPHHVQMKSGRL